MSVAQDLLSPEGYRIDGRRSNELRRVAANLGFHEDADGSALFEMGQTKVMALVYGPHESKSRSLHDKATITAEFRISPFASAGERKYFSRNDRRLLEMAIYIKSAFEQAIQTHLLPRSQIDIQLFLLQNDGGTLHAAVNAATLALINAGIPMTDYLCACSAGSVENEPILDLNSFEESSSYNVPKFTVAVLPNSGKVVMLNMECRVRFEKFDGIKELAVNGATQIRSLLDTIVRHSTITELERRSALTDG